MNKLLEIFQRWLDSANFVSSLKILAGLVVIVIGFIYLGQHMPESDGVTPCSQRGFPGRCYEIDPDACEVVWHKEEKTCETIVEKLKLPPGRLANPIVVKCQWAGLDKAFRYNRRSNKECDEAFSDLEGWVRRNEINP